MPVAEAIKNGHLLNSLILYSDGDNIIIIIIVIGFLV